MGRPWNKLSRRTQVHLAKQALKIDRLPTDQELREVGRLHGAAWRVTPKFRKREGGLLGYITTRVQHLTGGPVLFPTLQGAVQFAARRTRGRPSYVVAQGVPQNPENYGEEGQTWAALNGRAFPNVYRAAGVVARLRSEADRIFTGDPSQYGVMISDG